MSRGDDREGKSADGREDSVTPPDRSPEDPAGGPADEEPEIDIDQWLESLGGVPRRPAWLDAVLADQRPIEEWLDEPLLTRCDEYQQVIDRIKEVIARDAALPPEERGPQAREPRPEPPEEHDEESPGGSAGEAPPAGDPSDR
jgi:hypothetical protein